MTGNNRSAIRHAKGCAGGLEDYVRYVEGSGYHAEIRCKCYRDKLRDPKFYETWSEAQAAAVALLERKPKVMPGKTMTRPTRSKAAKARKSAQP